MKLSTKLLLVLSLSPSVVSAIPVLQVGASNSTYLLSSTIPTETDTAVTTDYTLIVGGVYRNNVVTLGGGAWSNFGWSNGKYFPTEFNGHGAVLVAAVSNGIVGSLTVNGNLPFMTSTTSMFPNNHDPVKDSISDFMYFDIGEFNNDGLVSNFTGEEGVGIGEVKELLISTTTGLPWVHFDVMALQYSNTKRGLLGTLMNNPGSHDATWKAPTETRHGIPAPGSIHLFGLGLLLMLLSIIINKVNPIQAKRLLA